MRCGKIATIYQMDDNEDDKLWVSWDEKTSIFLTIGHYNFNREESPLDLIAPLNGPSGNYIANLIQENTALRAECTRHSMDLGNVRGLLETAGMEMEDASKVQARLVEALRGLMAQAEWAVDAEESNTCWGVDQMRDAIKQAETALAAAGAA